MREQSAWLPATPRARREEETVGAERRGPSAAATAATSKRGPCSRASERFPQPPPPLLTPPPPALGPPQQFAGSAATEGAWSRSPKLVRSAPSQSRRRAGGLAAAGGYALPGLRPLPPDPCRSPDPPKGPAVQARPGGRALLRPANLVPALLPRRCPSGGWTDYCSSLQQTADWESQPRLCLFNP